jgi:xanthine dehydrogenase YagR molybdenum-binding subunit
MTVIGQPINRVDGPRKVTGRATYAYEQWEVGQPLYGYIVGATIGKGIHPCHGCSCARVRY